MCRLPELVEFLYNFRWKVITHILLNVGDLTCAVSFLAKYLVITVQWLSQVLSDCLCCLGLTGCRRKPQPSHQGRLQPWSKEGPSWHPKSQLPSEGKWGPCPRKPLLKWKRLPRKPDPHPQSSRNLVVALPRSLQPVWERKWNCLARANLPWRRHSKQKSKFYRKKGYHDEIQNLIF